MNTKRIILNIALVLALLPMTAWGGGRFFRGAVYAMTNAPQVNEIVVFQRDHDGRLTLADSYATAGAGSGGGIDALGSQGALILSRNYRWLIAVNAGSNDISVFRARGRELDLVGNFDSGGAFPVSLALRHNLLYVLNAGQDGGGPNITGFTLNRHGELTRLPGSTRSLGPGGFHQIGFNPRGDALVITQGDPNGVNAILVFKVNEEGLPDVAPTVSASAGVVPFGFVFDFRGHLLVAEAGSGAVSSYRIREDNTLEAIDASVSNGNRATCWIAGTWFGAVFTSNTGSDNLSSYRVNPGNGGLRLTQAVSASGNKPIDMATTADGRYLYVLNAGDGSVGAFRTHLHGSLEDLGTITGLPPLFSQGIAVR
jgi:6-phosphogluconolactonase